MMTNMMMMVITITWKSKISTARFVIMFYRSWTGLFRNLGFEPVRINFGGWAQWKVTPWRLEMKHHKTAHVPLFWCASSATRSPYPLLPPCGPQTWRFWINCCMNASDVHGDGDDDEDVGRHASINIRIIKVPCCENVLQILRMTPPKLEILKGPDEFVW